MPITFKAVVFDYLCLIDYKHSVREGLRAVARFDDNLDETPLDDILAAYETAWQEAMEFEEDRERILAEHKYQFHPDIWANAMGHDSLHVTWTEGEYRFFEDAFASAYKESFRAAPHARSVFNGLKENGYRVAVVTKSSLGHCLRRLHHVGLLDDDIEVHSFSGEDSVAFDSRRVAILAAQYLGVSPWNTVNVTYTETRANGALNGGALAISYLPESESESEWVFVDHERAIPQVSSLDQLFELLEDPEELRVWFEPLGAEQTATPAAPHGTLPAYNVVLCSDPVREEAIDKIVEEWNEKMGSGRAGRARQKHHRLCTPLQRSTKEEEVG